MTEAQPRCFCLKIINRLEDWRMENEMETVSANTETLRFDFGTFEGFNFRTQSAIWPNSTAEEVINWDHDQKGEAEFWPSGDEPGVQLVCGHRSNITSSQLIALDQLLHDLDGDSDENFLRVHFAVNVLGYDLCTLSAESLEDESPHIFLGSSLMDVRKEAAFELFELYHPDEYRVWEKSTCDGLTFDEDRFLDSPSFTTEEVRLGDNVALLVSCR